jgi:hypothetical protein
MVAEEAVLIPSSLEMDDDDEPAHAGHGACKRCFWQSARLISMIWVLCLGAVAANAQFLRDSPQNLGDVPGNGAAALPNCSKVSFLGPMITAYCTNSSNLIIKSEIDVRACVGYLVAEDNASGNLICRQPMHR